MQTNMIKRQRWFGVREEAKGVKLAGTVEDWLEVNKDDLVYCESLGATIHKRHCTKHVSKHDNEYKERRVLTYCKSCPISS